MRTACLRVSSVNALQKASTRNEESIVESREVHLKHLLNTGAVTDWNTEDAIKTGAIILSEVEVVCERDCHVQGPICVCSSIG